MGDKMQILNDSVEIVKLSSLKTHPENPRRGNLDELKRSINTNGFWGAVVVQKSTGHILAGNHRVMAARDLGAKKMPVVFVDVDDQTAKRILIADNRLSDQGEYDENKLFEILDSLNNTNTGLEGLGYDKSDLDYMLKKIEYDSKGHGELNPEMFSNFKHTCPRCGFEWDD